MKRLFSAVRLEPDDQFIDFYDDLRAQLRLEKINWVKSHNIHLTLKFFGDTPEDQLEAICRVQDQVAGRHRSFSADICRAGIFGSSYNPRVIWVGTDKPARLTALGEDLLDSLAENAFPRDRQNFRPHITLGRIKFIRDKHQFQDIIDDFKNTFVQMMPVAEFHLIESRLRPTGPEYDILETFKLK